MNKTHFKFQLRKDRANSDGCYPIYFSANINGQVKYFTLNHAIPEKVWNPKKQEVSITFPQWQTINNDLARFRSKAERIRIEADQEGLHINMFEFEKVFRGGSKDLSDVFEFIKNDLEEFRNSYASDTIKMYQSQSKKLKTFRTRLSFTEISPFFWKQYDSYLIKLGNNDNTRWKAFRSLKTFINKAIDSGLLKSDPLRGVKVRKPEGNRQFLTQEELKKLEKLNTGFLTKDLKCVLQYFLFSCYTGLRYEDIRLLKAHNVFLESGNEVLQFTQHKTKQAEILPLSSKAVRLIDKSRLQHQPLFRVYSNQVTNRHLKKIMVLAHINKDISFHCARHTFATIGLEVSGDIATVSKLLGHRKIQTTQIYAKVMDKSKRDVIKLMDAI